MGATRFCNDAHHYGIISILLHWSMALLILGLFFLGKYMVDLDYYHPWYQKAPDLHRSLGVVVATLLVLRWIWRQLNPRPAIIGSPLEQRLASNAHRLFYVLIALAAASGYLISTADGRGIEVFGLFQIPALFDGFDNQEDLAGKIHEALTLALVVLAAGHGLAALKHHFIDRDDTLRRMLRPGRATTQQDQED